MRGSFQNHDLFKAKNWLLVGQKGFRHWHGHHGGLKHLPRGTQEFLELLIIFWKVSLKLLEEGFLNQEKTFLI